MGNVLGIVFLVIGMVIGLIPFYLLGQQDWMAIITLGPIMFVLDMLYRMNNNSAESSKRFWHPKAGGNLAFLPSWVWGAAAFGYAIYIRFIALG